MTKRRAAELTPEPSKWALRELPARVVVFLRAAGTHPPLRAALEAGGYGPSEHAEGLRLLALSCPYRSGGFDPAEDATAREAVAELERWAKRHLGRLRAALERLHPEAARIVPEANGLDGANALLAVTTLLGRVRELEGCATNGAVLETLERRGFDAALRRRLAALVEAAQRAERPREVPALDTETNDGVEGALVELCRWYEDWAATARALVVRRDWLLKLGLRERTRRRVLGAAE